VDIQGDFVQYVSMKQALLSGGVNHVDTGAHFRYQQSERVVGAVLHTLQEKYGRPRSQFFITSKQGFTAFDEGERCPRDIEVQEVIAHSGGKLTPKDFVVGVDHGDREVVA